MQRLHAEDARGPRPVGAAVSASRLWLRRSSARAGLLAAAAAIAVLVSYLAVVIVGLALLSQAPAVRDTLKAGPVQTIGVQVQAPLSTHQEAQNAAARGRIAALLPGVPIHVTDLVETSPIRLGESQAARSGASSVVLMLNGAPVRDGIRIVSGRWPAADVAGSSGHEGSVPAPVAVQADAARRLGLSSGDTITVPSSNGAVTLRVAATWRVRDAAAPIWFGDQRVATGRAQDAVGPFIVTADVLDRFDTTPSVNWVVTPDSVTTSPADVPVLARGFGAMASALSADDAVTGSRVSVTGDGRQTALSMQQSMASLAAVVPLPVAVLAVGTILALVLLARLTADTRAAETTLLRARGANGALLVRAAAAESAVIGVIGSVIGATLAALTLWIADAAVPSAAVLLIPPAIVALCVVVVQTGVVLTTVRRALGVTRDAGRGRTAASVGLTVLVVLAAAFALWRFTQYSGPGGALDVASVAAPALALLAIALLGLVAFAPLARMFEAVGARSRRVGLALPARQVGRGLGFFTAPVALVILAVAASLLGSGFYGTWAALSDSAAHAVNAADVRVQTALAAPVRGAADSVGAPGYAAIPGITAAVPALNAPAEVGETQLAAVATASDRLGAVEGTNARPLEVPSLRRALSPATVPGEIALPAGTTRLAVDMATAGDTARAGGTVGLTIWLCDHDGELIPLDTGALPATDHVSAPPLTVPAGSWRIVAIDVALDGGGTADADTWRITRMDATTPAGTTSVPTGGIAGWRVVSEPFDTPPGVTTTRGIGFSAPALDTAGGATARLMPGVARRPPVAVTTTFAQTNGLGVHDAVSVDGGWWSVDATVAATVPMVPGERSPDAVLFDLGTVERAVLRTTAMPPAANQVWASASDPARVETAVRRHAGAAATVTIADTAFVGRFLTSAFVGLALGCAGCIALAIIAIAAATAALSRRRRPEVAVFRALGFTAREQAASRGAELWVITGVAAVIGAAAGILVTLLVSPTLARLTVVTAPAALPLAITMDAGAVAVALVFMAAAATAVILVYRAAVRRQAGDAEYREDAR